MEELEEKQVFGYWFASAAKPCLTAGLDISFCHCLITSGPLASTWTNIATFLAGELVGKRGFASIIHDQASYGGEHLMYPSPLEMINLHGADALRLYLLNTRSFQPQVFASGVRSMLKEIILPWSNLYRFLVQNAMRFSKKAPASLGFNARVKVLDHWILSEADKAAGTIHHAMATFQLRAVVPSFRRFLVKLMRVYVRLNKRRLKGQGADMSSCARALSTLYEVILQMSSFMRPFVPFLCGFIRQNLTKLAHSSPLFVPKTERANVDHSLRVERLVAVLKLARRIREENKVPVKWSVRKLIVAHAKQAFRDDIELLEEELLEEVNAKELVLCDSYKPSRRVLAHMSKGELVVALLR